MFMETESIQKIKQFNPFIEYVGTLRQVECRDVYVTVFLSSSPHEESKQIFTFSDPEAKTIVQKLQKLIGKKVGILETDDPSHPIRIRVIGKRNSSSTLNIGV